MIVEPAPLSEIPIVVIRAAMSDASAGVVAGETLGYYCGECGQCDETLEQIVHREGCPLAGEHGRAVYGPDLAVPSFDHGSRGELQPETRFSLLQWAGSLHEHGIVHNDIVGFRCDCCGNLDEHLFEIAHDEVCDIADLPEGRQSGGQAAVLADGGEER